MEPSQVAGLKTEGFGRLGAKVARRMARRYNAHRLDYLKYDLFCLNVFTWMILCGTSVIISLFFYTICYLGRMSLCRSCPEGRYACKLSLYGSPLDVKLCFVSAQISPAVLDRLRDQWLKMRLSVLLLLV